MCRAKFVSYHNKTSKEMGLHHVDDAVEESIYGGNVAALFDALSHCAIVTSCNCSIRGDLVPCSCCQLHTIYRLPLCTLSLQQPQFRCTIAMLSIHARGFVWAVLPGTQRGGDRRQGSNAPDQQGHHHRALRRGRRRLYAHTPDAS